MYDQDLVEAVLRHADIVQVISSYIPVTKKGRSYVALCPFHDDKNPSMQISAEKQIFKCFACGTGGNAIGFVEKYEKIPFAAAMRKVAKICGYSDPRLVEQAPKVVVDPSKQKLYDCINDLQAFYRYSIDIPEGADARNYLDARGLTAEVRAKYGIGYAPLDGQSTVKFLQAKGHSLKSIDDIGVALARGDATSDHNAGRVIFPLHDPNGQVVGFSARRIRDDGTAKYVNSPETALFQKGNILYNYHNVVGSAHRDGYCYVLEGFMDVMALDKAGIPNAVALMGTALTSQQIGLLKRLRCEVRLCLDGDGPGQMAMMKACALLTKAGVKFRLVDYDGDDRDPDDILRAEGPEALHDRLSKLVEAVDFQLGYYRRNKHLETASERKQVLESFLPALKAKPAGIEFEDMLVKLSAATGYQPDAIRELVRQLPDEGDFDEKTMLTLPKIDPHSAMGMRRALSRLETAERTMVHYMLHSPEAIAYFEQNIAGFSSASLYATIAEFVMEYSATHDGNVEIDRLLALIDSSEFEDREKIGQAVSELAFDESLPPYSESAVRDCAQIISDESLILNDKMAARRAIETGSVDDGAQANKELAAKIKERWDRKPKKG